MERMIMNQMVRRRGALRAVAVTIAIFALGISACGGPSETVNQSGSSPSVSKTGAPSKSAENESPEASQKISPTVTVFARTEAPAEEVLASSSEAIQGAPTEVLSAIAWQILTLKVKGPVSYARLTRSSVLSDRMKWFTDDELDGVNYMVVVPYEEKGMHYLLVTSRPPSDLRETNSTRDREPADLSPLGKVYSLTDEDLNSISDWRPFLNRTPEPSKGR